MRSAALIFLAGFIAGILLTALAFAFIPVSAEQQQTIITLEQQAVRDIIRIEPTSNISFQYIQYNVIDPDNVTLNGLDGLYFESGNSIQISSSLPRMKVPFTISHELCHSFTYALGCNYFSSTQQENVCDLYAYYRHPISMEFYYFTTNLQHGLYNEYRNYTTQLLGKPTACLDTFFRNFRQECSDRKVLSELNQLCGVVI